MPTRPRLPRGGGDLSRIPPDPLAAVRDPARLTALRRLGLLDTPAEEAFDRLARLASTVLKAPAALVSLVDEDRQFFKSCLGLPEPWTSWRQTPLSHSFCQHVVASGDPLIVPDAREHPLVRDNPAIADLGCVAYLGIPLVTAEGQALGSFCVIDHVPRQWTPGEVGILRDLAASVMTEIELRGLLRQHQRIDELKYFEALVENAPDVIVVLNADGSVRYESPAIERVLGYRPEERIGRSAFELVHPDDVPSLAEVFGRGLEVPEFTAPVEFRLRHRDGSWRVVEGIGRNLLHDPDLGGVVFNYRDVTEQRRMADSLRQSEKLAAMGSLLAGVAHELNNPLAVVLGHAALLQKAVGGGPLAQRAEKIAQAAERCSRIVKNFLALARQRPPERSRVRLNRVIEEAIELLAYSLRVDDIEVRLDLGEDLPVLWADPHQLHQVVVNLVTNAHHAMREASSPGWFTITTGIAPAGERVFFEVADTGPGIPPEVRARLFEPFFTTKPPGQGTGLGLSLCRGIVEGHGGTIGVESPPDRGAIFRVELPVTAPPEAAAEAPVTTEAERAAAKRILVVDDEPEVAGVLAEMLAADGHEVETAPNGARALERLEQRPYDLIVSDLRMPELDGPGLYRELERRHPALRRRVVFLTGDMLGPDTGEFLERVGAPSLGKPFNHDEVRRVVGRALDA